MIEVYFYENSIQSYDCKELLLSKLPKSDANKLRKYKNDRDIVLSAVGKLIVFNYVDKLINKSHKKNKPFSIGEFGKPFIVDAPNFNISHSRNIVIVCLSKNFIGIDIESTINEFPKEVIDYFSEEEKSYITCSNDYYKLWVLKESYVKYTGKGLSDIESINFNSSELKTLFSVGYLKKVIKNQALIFKLLHIKDNYQCAICTDGNNHIMVKKVKLENIL